MKRAFGDSIKKVSLDWPPHFSPNCGSQFNTLTLGCRHCFAETKTISFATSSKCNPFPPLFLIKMFRGYILLWIAHFYDLENNGWHGGLMQWCIVGSIPTRDGQLCVVCMLLCTVPSLAVLPGVLIYLYGELAVWISSLPLLWVCIDHRHWFHWTAVWLQLHVSLVYVSACSFAVSQAWLTLIIILLCGSKINLV